MTKKKYYITTAIAYTSKTPHIGNTYEAVITDAIARYKRLTNHDVFFLTGTDEHGQKIQRQAKEEGLRPQDLVDRVAKEVKDIWDMMGTSYDYFIRTTDPDHIKRVQKIFKKMYENGDIYKGEYEGHYCTACESFFTDSQSNNGNCPDCNIRLEETKEEAYFLKLSKYQDRLMKHIEENPEFIQPESRKNEMVNNFLKPGLQDLCVSRTSFEWGVPVDFDPGHVVYVWIDALSNYITALGFDPDNPSDKYRHYWPADVHIIGKDILRFHTIYWPIMLMSLGQPLPKQVFGHPWLMVGTEKMSKHKGNTIYAKELVDLFGVDAVRYFLLREMPFAHDGTLTYPLLIHKINSDLANVLGNLVNRTIAMINKYFDGKVYEPVEKEEIDNELIDLALRTPIRVEEKMKDLRVADAINAIWDLLRRSNKYIDETMPWLLGKDESKADRLKTVLYNLLESIRFSAVLLQAFLPTTAEEIFKQINTDIKNIESLEEFGQIKEGNSVGQAKPLFVRIDEKKLLKEINKEAEKSQAKDGGKKEKTKEEVAANREISIDDFAKLDLRVGQVLECKKHEKADKLLVSKIEIGDQVRQIVSGIADSYKPEDLVGKQVVVVSNLKPVKLRGEISQGMILCVDDKEGKPRIVSPEIEVDTGSKVM